MEATKADGIPENSDLCSILVSQCKEARRGNKVVPIWRAEK